ncbi:MAG: CAP domain-containing protein [Cyanobacteria bacterium J06623_5]
MQITKMAYPNFSKQLIYLGLSVALLTAAAVANDPAPRTSASRPDLWSPMGIAQAQATELTDWAAIEENLLIEHNRVRQNPQSYIPILAAYRASMDAEGNIPNGCGQNCTMITREGKAAVEEAIAFLQNQPPVGPLASSSAMAQAAKSHAQDQSSGAVGHRSTDGSSFAQRLSRFGVENVAIAENITYGPSTAQEVVMSLIVDDGVAGRGHRTTIFSPEWAIAGIGCNEHATFGTVCVIDYAAR